MSEIGDVLRELRGERDRWQKQADVCRAQRDALLMAAEDAVEELRTDENYVSENGAEAEFLVKLRAAIAKARGER